MTMNLEQHTQTEETREKADILFDKATTNDLHRKHGTQRVKEATLKIAARQNQEMIQNTDELNYYDSTGLDKRARSIARELGENTPPYRAPVYLDLYSDDEDITQEQLELASELVGDTAECQELVGKSPSAKAAAAIYIAGVLTDNYLPNHQIADKGHTSQPTLRKVYNIMVEDMDLQDKFIDHHPYPTRTKWNDE